MLPGDVMLDERPAMWQRIVSAALASSFSQLPELSETMWVLRRTQ